MLDYARLMGNFINPKSNESKLERQADSPSNSGNNSSNLSLHAFSGAAVQTTIYVSAARQRFPCSFSGVVAFNNFRHIAVVDGITFYFLVM